MPKYELGEVIAERKLELRSKGSTSTVRLRIGRPVPAGEDWHCPYEIDAQGSKRTIAIYGVDAIQALTLALNAIDVELEVIARHAAGVLYWLGEPFTSLQSGVDPKRSAGPRN